MDGTDDRFDQIEREHGYVRARLTLLATQVGGRKTPCRSGYRPQWDLGDRTPIGEISYHDAQVRLVDRESLAPGDEAIVRLHPLVPEQWRDLEPGSMLGLYEGNRRLGEAIVLALVAPEEVSADPPA